MARSYLPTLLMILETVCRYIIRYRTQILSHLPAGSEAALDGVVTACNALTALVGILPIGD
uniref:Uncharacterized protein n=1 Tax=uncultured prokaryote TaxID=198431 RepID=A0A0H5Q4M6_9ZZZZ|nr:hypothetical protein [uncultured prokaryote]